MASRGPVAALAGLSAFDRSIPLPSAALLLGGIGSGRDELLVGAVHEALRSGWSAFCAFDAPSLLERLRRSPARSRLLVGSAALKLQRRLFHDTPLAPPPGPPLPGCAYGAYAPGGDLSEAAGWAAENLSLPAPAPTLCALRVESAGSESRQALAEIKAAVAAGGGLLLLACDGVDGPLAKALFEGAIIGRDGGSGRRWGPWSRVPPSQSKPGCFRLHGVGPADEHVEFLRQSQIAGPLDRWDNQVLSAFEYAQIQEAMAPATAASATGTL